MFLPLGVYGTILENTFWCVSVQGVQSALILNQDIELVLNNLGFPCIITKSW